MGFCCGRARFEASTGPGLQKLLFYRRQKVTSGSAALVLEARSNGQLHGVLLWRSAFRGFDRGSAALALAPCRTVRSMSNDWPTWNLNGATDTIYFEKRAPFQKASAKWLLGAAAKLQQRPPTSSNTLQRPLPNNSAWGSQHSSPTHSSKRFPGDRTPLKNRLQHGSLHSPPTARHTLLHTAAKPPHYQIQSPKRRSCNPLLPTPGPPVRVLHLAHRHT